MKFKVAVLAITLSLSMQQYAFGQSANSEVLKVEIHQGEKPVSIDCSIRNITNKRLEYWSWFCSYFENWTSNNKNVSLGWECNKNFPVHQVLEPGQSHEWKLPMTIDPNFHEDHVTFRMAFKPTQLACKPTQPDSKELEFFKHSIAASKDGSAESPSTLKGLFWSNEITIETKK